MDNGIDMCIKQMTNMNLSCHLWTKI